MPALSVITVNLNNKTGLDRTLDSVRMQKDKAFEFVVVDGNSTDGSQELIDAHKELIDVTIFESDTGVYNAMNKGIKAATGDYLLFLNSGDHFVSESSTEIIMAELAGEDLICFDIAVEGQGHNFVKQHPDKIDLSYMLTDTLAHQAVVIKRNLFKKLGYYDESLKIVADWKFFLEALLLPQTAYKAVHKTLTHYYLDGMSATAKGTFKRRAERKELIDGHFAFLKETKEEHLLLQTNRFKMLRSLESSKVAQKLNSAWLRLLLRLFMNKGVNQL